MRGKDNQVPVLNPGGGITPAYAGKRVPLSGCRWFHRDHPRVCGEKIAHPIEPIAFPGSPPRMRGKVLQIIQLTVYVGITPAYAGKSGSRCISPRSGRDHPRVCGEKDQNSLKQATSQGPTPIMRGKDTKGREEGRQGGITPAYAGKSILFYSPRVEV